MAKCPVLMVAIICKTLDFSPKFFLKKCLKDVLLRKKSRSFVEDP